MLLIETPGESKDFKARITAVIKFTKCTPYINKKSFYKDTKKHLVGPRSKWAWQDKPKFGWHVEVVRFISPPILLSNLKKGIVYTKNIELHD